MNREPRLHMCKSVSLLDTLPCIPIAIKYLYYFFVWRDEKSAYLLEAKFHCMCAWWKIEFAEFVRVFSFSRKLTFRKRIGKAEELKWNGRMPTFMTQRACKFYGEKNFLTFVYVELWLWRILSTYRCNYSSNKRRFPQFSNQDERKVQIGIIFWNFKG